MTESFYVKEEKKSFLSSEVLSWDSPYNRQMNKRKQTDFINKYNSHKHGRNNEKKNSKRGQELGLWDHLQGVRRQVVVRGPGNW